MIDINLIDAKSLEEISYFKDAGLNDLKNMKADALVDYMWKKEGHWRIEKSSEVTWLFSDFVMWASDKII